ncbi:ATP-binding protein [Roseofilum capinflatum]|uniref:histidine kinase n=1 Tax=Roseofilum capinflatum BLCC-M114 TaxID=3022440 RepID=A0ABT7BAT4_9CYAN|nr:ATP-binding protein [Roseofilum capinflatum]MDJ1175927.1 ATP-binding protein [Roseofilum capinflatum BLCC-M114]
MYQKRHWCYPSLQTIFILPFLLEILIAVGLVSYFSFRNGRKSVEKIAYELLDETSDRVQEKITHFLSIPEKILYHHQELVNQNFLDLQNLDAWVPYLWSQSQYYQSEFISSIQVTNLDGEYRAAGASHDAQGTVQSGIAVVKKQNNFQMNIYYDLDSFFSRNNPDEVRGYFAVKNRPWFKAAIDNQGMVWTDVYARFIHNQNLTISLSSLLFRPGTDQIEGVTSVLVDIQYLKNFLQSLNLSQTGQAFIVDQSGQLVATSLEETLVVENNGEIALVNAINSQDPITRTISKYIEIHSHDFTKFEPLELSSLKINQQKYFIKTILFSNKKMNWWIVLAIPESDFMAEINQNTRNTIKLCILALCGTIVIGILTARWVTQPLTHLNQYAQKVAQGDWSSSLELNRQDEIGELAHSFNHMIKELKTSFSTIQDNEQRVQQFLESIPLGVAIHNLDGTIHYINEKGRQLLQIKSDKSMECSLLEMNQYYQIYKAETDRLYPPEELPVSKSLLGEKVYSDNLIFKQENQTIEAEVWTTPIYNQQGEIIYAIAVFQDITQRKQTDRILRDYNHTLETKVQQRTEQLYYAKEVAEVANRTKSLFLANMSHELRSPLNSILGFSQLMVRSENLSTEQEENLQIIHQSGTYLLSLINNVLDLSKIEAGKVSLNLNDFNLYTLLKEIEQSFQDKIICKQLQFKIHCNPGVSEYICTDKVKLRQILTNLLSNAFKFTETGSIEVRVEQYTSSESTQLEFTVSDTGQGIAAEEFPNLFQPFGQTQSGKNHKEGTGLGLSISQKFIQLMGGDIRVESEVGQGTRFVFMIKVTPSSTDQMIDLKVTPRVIKLQAGQPNYQILVVDDQPNNCKLLTKFLQPVGFYVKMAHTGEEAIKIWRQWQPDLIWMDMRMPVMDGYEAVRQIRAQEGERKTIIIALTASIVEEEKALSLLAGCDDVVSKPFEEDLIFQMMAQYLGVRYVYEQERQDRRSPNSDVDHPLTPEDLQRLPVQWRQEMAQATLELNDRQVLHLVEQIQSTNPDLAETLMQLMNDFRFDQISEWVSTHS